MDNTLNVLKEKITTYNRNASGEGVKKDNSELDKIKNSISELTKKMNEIKSTMKNKTKIEQMKMTLELSSIESEIKLKELEIEDIKNKIETAYNTQVKEYNNNIATLETEINNYIKALEENIENAIKYLPEFKVYKEPQKQLVLNKDLLDIKGYYKNIMSVERKDLDSVSKELKSFDSKIQQKESECKNLDSYIKDCYDRAHYWAMKDPVSLFGNYDEDKAEEYQDNMEDAHREAERYEKERREKLNEKQALEKSKQKIIVRKEAAEKKIKTIDEMVDEMIKEIVKEEMKKKDICVPKFVSKSKYIKL